MSVVHYGFSGFACSGKTTLIKRLYKDLQHLGKEVYIFPEIARYSIDLLYDFNHLDNFQELIDFSVCVTQNYLLDWLYNNLTKSTQNLEVTTVFLHDRVFIDNVVFMILNNFITLEQAIDFVNKYRNKFLKVYNIVFLIGELDDISFVQSVCMQDKARESTIKDFFNLQAVFYEYYLTILSECFEVDFLISSTVKVKNTYFIKVNHFTNESNFENKFYNIILKNLNDQAIFS